MSENKGRGLTIKVGFYVSETIHAAMKEAAAREGKSLGQWLREAAGQKASQEPVNPWEALEKRDNDDLREQMQRHLNRGDRG